MRKILVVIFTFILFFTLIWLGHDSSARFPAQQQEGFDEIVGTVRDSVRAAYKGVIEIFNRLSEKEKEEILRQTEKDFLGDNPLLPLPRVLTEDEQNFLSKGVDQRGRALKEFLKDHYSGKKKYAQENIIPGEVVDRIIARSGEQDWQEFLRSEHIQFWYGPDIIRGPPTKGAPEGVFYVVEDNPGFIGGMGDLLMARESLLDKVPEYADAIDSPDPQRFYEKLANRYKREAQRFGGVPVIIQHTNALAADNEDKRVKKIFNDLGVEVVSINYLNPRKSRDRNIVIEDDGAWLEVTEKGRTRREKVGHVVLNMDAQLIDLDHPAAHYARIIGEAENFIGDNSKESKELEHLLKKDPQTGLVNVKEVEEYLRKCCNHGLDRKTGIPGLFDAFFAGKLGMTNVPGVDFIGDKELYMYVEAMIDFYLQEQPILKNIETGSFRKFDRNGNAVLDEAALDRIFRNIKNYVIKGVDGRGGDAVWVGPKVKAAELNRVKEMIKKDPSRYIFQKFTPLSHFDGYIGDLRLISEVGRNGVIVTEVPWARAVPMSGDGKVNISASGREATVLVRKGVKSLNCQYYFKLLTQ